MSNINEQELVLELQKQIKDLLESQELKDLDTFTTEKEIDTLIAVEQGHAFQIRLDRDPLPFVSIIVLQSSTVLDIKQMIKYQLEKMEKKASRRKKISW